MQTFLSAVFDEEAQAKAAAAEIAELMPDVAVSLYCVERADRDDHESLGDHIRSFVAEVVGPGKDSLASGDAASTPNSAWCKLSVTNALPAQLPALESVLQQHGGRIDRDSGPAA